MDQKDRKDEQWQGEERRHEQGNFKGDDRRKGGANHDQQAQDGLEEG